MVSLESRRTPRTLSDVTLSAPSMRGLDGTRAVLDLARARRKEYREAVKSKFPYERKNSTSRHKDSWSNDSVFKPTYRPTSTGSFIGAFKPPDIPTASHIMEKAYLPQKDIPVA